MVLIAMLVPALLTACGQVGVTSPSQTPTAPPGDDALGIVAVETPRGRAAAELVAQPAEMGPGGRTVVRVANRGNLRLGYGRPLKVEWWNGQAWVETDESREAAWTMELILLEPNEIGVEQRWPFREGQRPQAGLYRFTKQVHVEDTANTPERITVMARVRVVEP